MAGLLERKMRGNPVTNKLEQEFATTPAGYPGMPGYQRGGARVGQVEEMPQPAYHEEQAAQPVQSSAAPRIPYGPTSRPMTYNDVLVRSWSCFAVLFVGALVGWEALALMPAVAMVLMTVSFIGALVCGIWQTFRSAPSRALILGYALFEGIALGSISAYTETLYPGIVLQALLGTLAVILVSLLLFKTGIVRVNSRFVKITVVSIIAILVYSLANLLLSFTGVVSNPLGLDGITLFGVPLGVIIGLFAVLAGAMSLIVDFDTAVRGVEAEVPSEYAWLIAFSVMVSVVWLYLEILRLLELVAYLSDND